LTAAVVKLLVEIPPAAQLFDLTSAAAELFDLASAAAQLFDLTTATAKLLRVTPTTAVDEGTAETEKKHIGIWPASCMFEIFII
jgi:hypothetical protein